MIAPQIVLDIVEKACQGLIEKDCQIGSDSTANALLNLDDILSDSNDEDFNENGSDGSFDTGEKDTNEAIPSQDDAIPNDNPEQAVNSSNMLNGSDDENLTFLQLDVSCHKSCGFCQQALQHLTRRMRIISIQEKASGIFLWLEENNIFKINNKL